MNINLYNETQKDFHNTKERKSLNPVASFFQQSLIDQKKAWKEIVNNANKMQKDLIK